MNYTLETYILLFFIYSCGGWLIEVIRMFLNPKYHKFINRGFLIGPYLPIYGSGVVAITLLLTKYKDDVITLFFLSVMTCGILEYGTSYIMEKLFNARWWDYSNKRFNINGRVCLENLIPFGLAGTLIICYINPFFINLINYLSLLSIKIISYSLVLVILIDTIISFFIISNLKNTANEIDLSEDDDTENISNYVKDQTELMAMQFESDIRKASRKRILKRKRKLLHLKHRTTKRIKLVQIKSEKIKNKLTKELSKELSLDFANKITNKLGNKIENIKISSEEFTNQIKENFSKKSLFNKRLLDAFPDMRILNIKNIMESKIKDNINNRTNLK